MDTPPTQHPLPAYAKEVLAALEPHIESTSDGLSRDKAQRLLREDGYETATIEAALEQLLLRGYLYEVNDQLRITERHV